MLGRVGKLLGSCLLKELEMVTQSLGRFCPACSGVGPSGQPRSPGLLRPGVPGARPTSGHWKLRRAEREPSAIPDGVCCQQLPPASLPNLEAKLELLEGEA